MKYQLVLQQTGSSIEDYDRVIDVECELEELLGDLADVDGHDFGSGEANIFIMTDDPKTTFNTVRPFLEESGALSEMRVAYRAVESDEFKVLWPVGLTEFKVT